MNSASSSSFAFLAPTEHQHGILTMTSTKPSADVEQPSDLDDAERHHDVPDVHEHVPDELEPRGRRVVRASERSEVITATRRGDGSSRRSRSSIALTASVRSSGSSVEPLGDLPARDTAHPSPTARTLELTDRFAFAPERVRATKSACSLTDIGCGHDAASSSIMDPIDDCAPTEAVGRSMRRMDDPRSKSGSRSSAPQAGGQRMDLARRQVGTRSARPSNRPRPDAGSSSASGSGRRVDAGSSRRRRVPAACRVGALRLEGQSAGSIRASPRPAVVSDSIVVGCVRNRPRSMR